MSLLSSRREQNKQRTRVAIQDAVLQAAAEHGFDKVTAEDVADRAGVSRRTFFNYYTGLDAVIADATQVPMQEIAEAFLARPDGEDPLLALINAVAGPMPVDLARWCAAPGLVEDPQHELHSRVWQRHTEWVTDMVRRRIGDSAPDLYVSTLVATVLHVFEAAQASWAVRCEGVITTDTRQAFTDEVRAALLFARDGWQSTPEQTKSS